MQREKTTHAARGQWKGIMLHLGASPECFTGRNAPCPVCGGTDRFTFDNREGTGSWMCRQCPPSADANMAAGHGMELVMRFLGVGFSEAADRVDSIIGNIGREIPREEGKPRMSKDEAHAALRRVAAATVKVSPGGLVDTYLRSRNLRLPECVSALREASSVSDGEGSVRPAMVATVVGSDGRPVTLHKTFLAPGGHGKAEMDPPRKTMTANTDDGKLPDVIGVRLYTPTDRLGIAEGIETAIAAHILTGWPVWAALNASMLAKWLPPEGVKHVRIFGDNDSNWTGQASASALARRLVARKLTVECAWPTEIDTDYADELAGLMA